MICSGHLLVSRYHSDSDKAAVVEPPQKIFFVLLALITPSYHQVKLIIFIRRYHSNAEQR